MISTLTEVPEAAAEAVTGDALDIGDGDGELFPDDGDGGGGLLDDNGVEEEPETGVISQRSKPDPVSELTKLVRPAPTAEFIAQVLELR